MTPNSKRIILIGMVEEKINKIKPKCKKNKRIFQTVTAGSIGLSAAITAILGLDWPEHTVIQKNIALALGLLLTIVNGWMAVFDYKKLWMRQKSTLFGLYNLQNELKVLEDKEEDLLRVKDLFNNYQSVWEKDASEWAQIYSSTADEPSKSKDK